MTTCISMGAACDKGPDCEVSVRWSQYRLLKIGIISPVPHDLRTIYGKNDRVCKYEAVS